MTGARRKLRSWVPVIACVALVVSVAGCESRGKARERANRAFERRVIEEIWNQGRLHVIDEIFSFGFVQRTPDGPDITGPAAFKQFVSEYRVAFPDVQFMIEDQISQGDRVVTRWSSTGTHKGAFMGILPTGLVATTAGVTIGRYSGGKRVESWYFQDALGMWQELGVVALVEPGELVRQKVAKSDLGGVVGKIHVEDASATASDRESVARPVPAIAPDEETDRENSAKPVLARAPDDQSDPGSASKPVVARASDKESDGGGDAKPVLAKAPDKKSDKESSAKPVPVRTPEKERDAASPRKPAPGGGPDDDWLMEQNPERWTIQLAALRQLDFMAPFKEEYQLKFVSAGPAQNGVFRVLYGQFENQEMGRIGQENLPQKLYDMVKQRGTLRRISILQKAVAAE